MEFFLAPLQYEFMLRGMAAAVLVGILCSVIGCFVVLRSMAFLGDAMAHAVLPGIAVAYIFGGNLTIGALIAALLVSVGIALLSQKGEVKEDTAIGIFFSSALALGIALISSMRSYAMDLSHILFGDILGVSGDSLWMIVGLGFVVLLILFTAFRPFTIISFDPVLAAMLHLPVGLLRTALLVLLSVTIVTSLKIVGMGLVTALLVTPAATAYLLVRRLPTMMLVAGLLGAVSGIVGLYVSYYANVASGAAIVLTATSLFLFAYLFSPRKGLLREWVRRARAKKQEGEFLPSEK